MSSSLWRHREFVKLWTAETISQLGSQMTMLALPLLAIGALGADPFTLGVLAGLEVLPFLVLSLPAGAWVDRMPRRPVLIAADLGRAVVLASIPVAHGLGVLSTAQLYAVALVAGALTVLFDCAYEAFLPGLVGRDQLVEGNAKLELSRSAATIAGPTIAGALVGLLSAAPAIALDAASFVASAAFVVRIRGGALAARPGAGPRASLRRDILEGLRYVFGQRYLRYIAGCTATSNLFYAMGSAILVIYLARDVGLSAGRIGLVFGIGNVGFLAGAIASGRAAARLGLGPTLVLAISIAGVSGFAIPVAPRALVAEAAAAGLFLSGLATTLYNINQLSLRQSIAPDHLRGRINATMRFVVWGTLPIGTVTGGALARALGVLPTLWIAAFGGTTAVLWLVLSPVRTLRTASEGLSAPAAPAGPG